jgi:hypothetical protein
VLLLIALCFAVPALLILPGYLSARRRAPHSAWILLISLPGLILWLGLTSLGIGAQSLGNLSELLGVCGVAVAGAYLSLLTRRVTPLHVLTAVLLVTLALRLFTPEIPE